MYLLLIVYSGSHAFKVMWYLELLHVSFLRVLNHMNIVQKFLILNCCFLLYLLINSIIKMMMTIEHFLFYAMVMIIAAVTYIDSSAVQALKDLYQEYKLRDIQVEIWTFNNWLIHEFITKSLQMFFPQPTLFFLSFCRLQYPIQIQIFCLLCLKPVWWSW